MNWLILVCAGLLECVWAVGLKYSDGFTKLYPSIWTLLAMILSFFLLAVAMRTLPLGTAYAVWTGIGTIGAAIIGMMFYHDPVTFGRIFCLSLILTGIIGLKILSKAS